MSTAYNTQLLILATQFPVHNFELCFMGHATKLLDHKYPWITNF